jgi:hypothetical protein
VAGSFSVLPDVARGDEAMTSENWGVNTRSERIWLRYRRSGGNFTAGPVKRLRSSSPVRENLRLNPDAGSAISPLGASA